MIGVISQAASISSSAAFKEGLSLSVKLGWNSSTPVSYTHLAEFSYDDFIYVTEKNNRADELANMGIDQLR